MSLARLQDSSSDIGQLLKILGDPEEFDKRLEQLTAAEERVAAVESASRERIESERAKCVAECDQLRDSTEDACREREAQAEAVKAEAVAETRRANEARAVVDERTHMLAQKTTALDERRAGLDAETDMIERESAKLAAKRSSLDEALKGLHSAMAKVQRVEV